MTTGTDIIYYQHNIANFWWIVQFFYVYSRLAHIFWANRSKLLLHTNEHVRIAYGNQNLIKS